MQHQKPTRILGHLEYEVNLPASRTVNSRKKTQIVQTNLNTTIQDIMDEVCRKHEYEKKDYELWYGQKKLDNEVTVRRSGLPVNGVLVLLSVADGLKLKDSNVNLGLQLESGKRLTHKFHHEETLWNVLQYWESQGEKILKSNEEEGGSKVMVPVCNFMRQTIVGQEQLEQQSLSSLGLTHGSAVIRLFHREDNQLGQQANVSAVMSIPITNVNANVKQSSTIAGNRDEVSSPASPNNNMGKSSDSTASDIIQQQPSQNRILEEPMRPKSTPLDTTAVKVPEEDSKQVDDGNVILGKRNVDDEMESNQFVDQEEVQKDEEPMDEGSSNDDVEFDEPLKYCTKGALNILGDNNALLYHLDDVRTRRGDEPPDEFFDITVKDLESIYRGLRAKAREFDEAPLLTSTLRQDEEVSAQDRMLKEHPATVVRIRFPDRFVLQGTFQSSDYISSLTSFVRQYLKDSTLDFTLFTTPPKTVLDETKTLLSSKLIGFAIVYIGTEGTRPEKYLRDDVYNQASDPGHVFKNSTLLTQTTTKAPTSDTLTSAQTDATSSTSTGASGVNVKSEAASSSSSKSSSESSAAAPRVTNRAPSGAVPKWFKGATAKKP